MVGNRSANRNIEFIHSMSRIITDKYEGALVVTIDPESIKRSLKNFCKLDVEFRTVYEGIKGLALDSPKRRKGYRKKIIGYEFRKI